MPGLSLFWHPINFNYSILAMETLAVMGGVCTWVGVVKGLEEYLQKKKFYDRGTSVFGQHCHVIKRGTKNGVEAPILRVHA